MPEATPIAETKPSRRRLIAFAALWAAISGAVLLAPGCYGRNCESLVADTFGTEGGEGRMLDENTWESSPQDGSWLWFPRQKYYIFDVHALGGRTPQVVIPYLSAQEAPNKGGNFTIGAGNLALLSNAIPNRIDVKNDTCSDYYLRLVVIAPGVPPAAGHPDGATSAPLDAGAEGGDVSDDAGDPDADDVNP
jgi:hypothetical protein